MRWEEALAKRPWLLPLAWVLGERGSCDHVVVAETLGVPVRLARSLTYHARRLGLCGEEPELRIVRAGREFAGEGRAFYFYAKLKGRRIAGAVLSKSGVEGKRAERLLGRVRALLGFS